MSEMVDRVAQAIADVWCDKPGNTEAARLFEKTARAAIAAMREPTLDMLGSGRRVHPYDCDVEESWPVMIDEALK